MMAAPTLRVEPERPLDEGTEWVVGLNRWTPALLLLRLNQWTPAPSTESVDFISVTKYIRSTYGTGQTPAPGALGGRTTPSAHPVVPPMEESQVPL